MNKLHKYTLPIKKTHQPPDNIVVTGSGNAFTATETPVAELSKEISDEEFDSFLEEKKTDKENY